MYVNFVKFNSNFDEKLRDILFEIRGPIETTNQITIIDIDEKSIETLGQWPFSRIHIAQVLANLANAGAGIIGLDIVFSEYDRSSPKTMAQQLGVQGDFIDSDFLLSNVVAQTPTILGYYFSNEQGKTLSPKVATVFDINTSIHTLKFDYVTTNIEQLTTNGYSSGFFNAFSDSNGKITKLPLILEYKNKIYPSLALEMITLTSGTKKIKVLEDDYAINGLLLKDFVIPTDENGFFRINFRGAKKTFKYLSFVDIYNGNFKLEDIKGKFILLGTSITTLADLRSTVYDLAMPGVEIHANLIDNLLKGDFLHNPPYLKLFDILFIFTLTILLGIILTKLNALYIVLITSSVFAGIYTFIYYLLFEYGLVLNLLYPLISIVATTFLAFYLNYTKEQKQKEFIKGKFSKKVSEDVVNDLLKNTSNSFEAQEKNITIYFSDIRGFTQISEQLNEPKKLIQLLNLYLEPMTNIITKNFGTVDKFIGDAIMAYWNAPKTVKNHADLAITSALEQIQRLKNLNNDIKKQYEIQLQIGIGIHTGIAVVGEMGSNERSDYTAIGDNVNIASRIEGLTKYLGANILISHDTKAVLKNHYHLRFVGSIIVKGKSKPISLYEVLTPEKFQNFKTLESSYNKAIELFYTKKFSESLELFTNLQQQNRTKLFQFYIEQCKYYQTKEITQENIHLVINKK
jgi:adenylate cyclase